jgi:UDP-2-acetamido-3-amino-2,3-dideoxy-glucuronate N-acetyltransferase
MSSVRVALFGCGQWGKNVARTLAEAGALAVVVDAFPAQAEALAKTLGVPFETDPAKVLADPTIQACAVTTPAETHFAVAKEAIRAGKDVFVEKPITTLIEDAIALKELAADQKRILMVGHLLQYHPYFVELLKRVRAGDLGKLLYIYSNRANLGRVRHTENALWSLAPHDVSMVLALANELPSSITANGAKALQPTIDDAVMTTLSFPSGVQGHIFSSWINPFKEQKLAVSGEKGMLVLDDTAPWEKKLTLHHHRIEYPNGKPEAKAGEAEYIVLPQAAPLREEVDHFLSCVQTRQQPRTDGAEALRVLRVLRACDESLASGKRIELKE